MEDDISENGEDGAAADEAYTPSMDVDDLMAIGAASPAGEAIITAVCDVAVS